MLKTLIRIRLKALFAALFARQRKKNRGIAMKILLGIFAVYIIGCFFSNISSSDAFSRLR